MRVAEALRAFVVAQRAQATAFEALANELDARDRASGGMELLTDRQVAAELCVSRAQVVALRQRGHFGNAVYVSPRCPRITRAGLERFKEVAAQKRHVA